MTIYHPPSDDTQAPEYTLGMDGFFDSYHKGPSGGCLWGDSGNKFFVGHRSSLGVPVIAEWSCSSSYDLSSHGTGKSTDISSDVVNDGDLQSFQFGPSGDSLFVQIQNADQTAWLIYKWDLTTSYDITSRTNKTSYQFYDASKRYGSVFSDSGDKLFVSRSQADIAVYNLSSNWNPQDISEEYDYKISVPYSGDNNLNNIKFRPDGTRIYLPMSPDGTNINEGVLIYDLSIPWDIRSLHNEHVWHPNGQEVSGIAFDDKGEKAYITANDDGGIYSEGTQVAHQFNIESSNQLITTVSDTDFSRESEPFLTVYEDVGGDDTGNNTTSYGETYNNSDTVALSDGKASYQLSGFSKSAGDELWAEVNFEGPITADSYVEEPIEIKVGDLNSNDGELLKVFYDYQTLDPSAQGTSPVTADTSGPLSLNLSTISPSVEFTEVVADTSSSIEYNYDPIDAGAVASGEVSSSLEKDTIKFTASESVRAIYAQGVIARVDNELTYDYSVNDLNADGTGETTASVDGPLEIDLSTFDPSKLVNGTEADTPAVDYDFSAVDIADIEVTSTSASPDGSIEFDIHQVEFPVTVGLNSGTDTSIDFTAIGGDNASEIPESGSVLHIPGNNNSAIYQYDGPTAFDTSSLSYNGDYKDVSSEDSNPKSVRWSYDGQKMYVAGANTLSIFEYDSSDFDATSAVYNGNSLDISSEITSNLEDMYWRPDGKRFYLVESNNANIYAYELSTAWDITTASYVGTGGSLDVSTQDGTPTGIAFSTDGSKLFVSGDTNSSVFEYDLSTAWTLSSASYNSVSKDVSTEDTNLEGIDVDEDGKKLYLTGKDNDSIFEYDLSTDWDLSSATYNSVTFDISTEDTSPESVAWVKSDDSISSGGFGAALGPAALTSTFHIQTEDPSLEVAGEASSTPESTTYDYKNYDVTPLFTGEVTPTPDIEDINFTNQDAQVATSGEAIADVPFIKYNYNVGDVTPFIGSGDFAKAKPDEIQLTTLDPSTSVSGEVSASPEIVEFDYIAPDPRPVYGRGAFISPYNEEIDFNALDVSGTGEGESSATPETVDYNIDYFGDAKPLIGEGDFVTPSSPEIVDFSSLDPNTDFTNTTFNLDSPTIFNISASSAKPLNLSGSEVLSNVPSLQFNISAADIFTEVGALINMKPAEDRLIISGPGIGVEKVDRREAEGISLQEKQEALAPDRVDVVKMGNSVYIREERVKEVDALEFILDDIDNASLTVEEGKNFRIESSRDLRMDLIEGSTLRRVRDFRKSGFNREEFAEQVAEEDLDLGG